VGRYLTNGAFAELVAGGWIGTTAAQTEILDRVIREIVASGRAVIVAVKRNLTLDEQHAVHAAAAAELEEFEEDDF
jgi:ABC-type cobalamin transport system ATPase subunit